MRTRLSLPLVTGVLMLIVGTLVFSCQRENISGPKSKETQVQSNTVTPCETCTDKDLVKTAGNPNVADEVAGVLQVCQPTATEISFTFTVSDTRENAWINQYGIRIDPTGSNFTALNLNPGVIDRTKPDGDKARQATITIDYTTFTKDDGLGGQRPLQPGDIICIAAYSVVVGPDGVGGQVWAGDIPPAQSGNPHPRSFCYVIKDCTTPPDPNPNCTFTQGYWFAKPGGWISGKGKTKIPSGSQWPGDTENTGFTFGGYSYTYLQARDIFFSVNKKTGKTDAKQAFLQGFALKLSMYGNSQTEPCAGTLDALNAIEAYFAGKAVKQTPASINSYASNASLRAAAGLISTCLNANHCDNTPEATN
jgi:hypothetical protein